MQQKSKRPFYRYRGRYGRFAVRPSSDPIPMMTKTVSEVPDLMIEEEIPKITIEKEEEIPKIIIEKEEEIPKIIIEEESPKIALTLPIHFIIPDSVEIDFSLIKDHWTNLASDFSDLLTESNIELTIKPELNYVDDEKYYEMTIFKPEEFIQADQATHFFIIIDLKKFEDEYVSQLPIKKILSSHNFIAVPIYDLTPQMFKPVFLSIALLREFHTFLASSRNNDDLESQMEDIDIHSGACVRKYKHNVNQTQKSITARVNALIKARYSHADPNLCNNCIKKLEKPFFKFLTNLGLKTSIELTN